MELASIEWLVVIINALVIGLVLTAPVLLVIIVVRGLRKGVSQDRQAFEAEVKMKLEEISTRLAEIQRQLEGRLSNDQM